MSADTPARADFSAGTSSLTGVQLVEAGAGTGKTHQIVGLFVRLLLERDLAVGEILVVTYTVAATAELRRRIRDELVQLSQGLEPGDARLERVLAALRGFDAAAIFTIHGFCQRVLRERAFESGSSFEAELVSDADSLLEEVAQDFWMRELCDADPVWVGYAVEQGWLPGRLATLAAQAAARPDLVLRPARGERPDVQAAEAVRRDAYRAVAQSWRAEGEALLDQVAQAARGGDLNRNSYKEEMFAPLQAALSRELATDTGARGLLTRIEKFAVLGQSHLRRRTNKRGVTPEHPFFERCDALIAAEAILDDALRARLVDFLHDFVDYARSELARRKRERDILFFDDLLLQLSAALAGPGGGSLAEAVRCRYPVALIDEFQDTDPVQYEVFRRIWQPEHGATLFLIGDPKQAIYGFRGADLFAYLRARDGVFEAREGGAGVHGLTANWRSDPALLRGLNALFGAGERPFLFEEIPYPPARPRPGAEDQLRGDRIASGLRVLELEPEPGEKLGGAWRSSRLARAVASEVARILAGEHENDGRPLRPGDIAVLTRTNRQARDMQSALREHGIAAVLQSEESVFETEEAAELERVLRAIADPEDPARVRAAVATTLLSESAADCVGLPGSEDDDGDAWERWGGCLRECRQIWAEQGVPRALRHLWTRYGVAERLLARADGERRVTNLHHLIELLHREAAEARLGPLSLLYWFGRRRAEARAGHRWVPEEAQLRLESDSDAVQLLTVHRAKGLQFEVTICPFLWDGTLVRPQDDFHRFHEPDASALVIEAKKPAALRSEQGEQLARREAFAENLRVAYVGLTRARHHCSLVWGRFSGFASSPLRHLVAPDLEGEEGAAYDRDASKRFKQVSDTELADALARAAAAARGGLRVERMDVSPGPLLPPGGRTLGSGVPVLESRVSTRSFPTFWRVSSFSGLVAFAAEERSELRPGRIGSELEEGRDYDAHTADAHTADAHTADAHTADAHTGDAPSPDAPGVEARAGAQPGPLPGGEAVRLAGFPAGAMPGILIHELFEEVDFVAADAGEGDLEALATAKLRARKLSTVWGPPLALALRDVLAVPLDPARRESRLGTLRRDDRIDEMPFTIPVATAPAQEAAGRASPRLTATALAAAFDVHAVDPHVRAYARRAARLGFTPLAGYLRGFVDIVFRREGRWYLADYKSNHLGVRPSDYRAEAMWQSMLEHDYVLQYHLYLVALHRHLAQRLPGYDYDAHMGGAYYLFVRGMAPAHAAGTGVLFDRPPRALVEALSQVLQ